MIRVVVHRDRETNLFVIACIDRPFLTQARTSFDIRGAFVSAFLAHQAFALAGGYKPFTGPTYPPLDAAYVEMFESGRPLMGLSRMEFDQIGQVEFRYSHEPPHWKPRPVEQSG